MRIRTRIMGAALAVAAFMCVIFLAYAVKKESDDAHAQLHATIEQTHQLLQVVIAGPLYHGKVEQLNANLDAFFRNPDLLEISLTEYQGNVRHSRKRAPVGDIGDKLQSKVVVTRGSDRLGEIHTVFTTANIEQRLIASRNEILLFAAALLIAVGIVTFLVVRGLTRPIDRLTEAARAMADGDLDRKIDGRGAQELVVLAESFARMRDSIREKMANLADWNARLNQEIAERVRTEQMLREKESKYRALAENIPQRIFYKDSQSRYLAVNQHYADDLGMAPGDFIGKDDYAIHPAELADRYRQDDRRVMESGQAQQKDERYVHGGRELVIHTIKTPVRDESGRVIGVCGIFSDVTEQRALERRLHDSEATLRAIYETAREGIMVSSTESGRLVMVNPGMCRMLGYTEAELLKMAPPDLHPPEVLPRLVQIFESMRHGEFGLTIDLPFRRKDGSVFYADASAGPVAIQGQVCFLGIFRDVTERRETEERLRRLNEGLEARVERRTAELAAAKNDAERASLAKSEFLSRMSHELRTPLNAILGFGQLLANDPRHPLVADQHESVREILHAGAHLLELINEVLDLARIEAGKLTMSHEPVPIFALIEESLTLVRPLAEMRAIRIVEAGTDCGRHVLADRTRLKQVLLNLLSNAVKYNRPQGTLSVNCLAAGDMVRINVTDTGPGLTPGQQARLFTAFERLDAESGAVEGTGIGLALSRRLIELMNGTIGVESTPGSGCTFWIRLPAAEANALPAHDHDVRPPGAGLAGGGAAGHRQRDILCIEDNPANLRLIERILTRRDDVRLLSAGRPGPGIELAAAHRPALILLDINLPDMDGYDAMTCLRENPATRDIPVVAISANAMPKDLARGKAAGFHDYLTKPLDVARLVAVIDDLLRAADRGDRP